MSSFNPPPTLRIPFVRRCVVVGSDGETTAMLLDLSLRGVYVATEELLPSGDEVRVRFAVPGNLRELEIPGLVAWVQKEKTHPVHGLPRGFGIRFSKLETEDVRLIARAIQSYCESNPIYRQYL
ncbi:MAG: PilZ domain-containing protein [Vicinamibacteria bacterium]